MKLSIITINRNNDHGLQKTMRSVLIQNSNDFEYIVIDGASTDRSVEILNEYKTTFPHPVIFISEPDTGIYNAMNKGIGIAKGEYLQFLNSGDILVAADVIERMLASIPFTNTIELKENCDIVYGNMLKQLPTRVLRDKSFVGRMPSMLDFYTGTLNHSSAFIKRSLFDTYGLYDEKLKIVSDWKWYLQVIIINGIVPCYRDIDVTIFDMNGISNIDSTLDKAERQKVLEELLPLSVLQDYKQYAFPIDQLKRIQRYWFTRKIFYFIERILFKFEKWYMKK